MAIKRLYAPQGRVDELADAVLARCEREVVGDGLADDVTLGPLHTASGRDRVASLVKDAAAQGATVRTAGRIREEDADSDGYFVLPTVVTGVAPQSALATEERSARCCRSSDMTTSTMRSPPPMRPSSD